MLSMQESLKLFLHELIIYDYILFGVVLITFILLVVIAILVRKREILSIFTIFIAFSILFGGSIGGYIELHDYLFKHKLELTRFKKLNFTEAVVIYATLANESKRAFSECKVTAAIDRVDNNKYKEMILKLKPIAKMSIIESNIDINETREIKMIVEPFVYDGDFNVSLKARCKW